MELKLTNDEAQALRDIIQNYLPDLRRELAGTDLPAREPRDQLHKRIALCERMLSQLPAADAKVSAR